MSIIKRKPLSESTKRKISLANKGSKRTKQQRLKMSMAKIGKPCFNGFKKGNKPWNAGLKTGLVPKTAFKKGHKHGVKQIEAMKKCKGEHHWNWKGGVSKLNLWRTTNEYRTWQQLIYKRYHWRCVICGKHCQKGDIIAHHVTPYSDNEELKYNRENGLLVCRGCHLLIHQNIRCLRKKVMNMTPRHAIEFLIYKTYLLLKIFPISNPRCDQLLSDLTYVFTASQS
jgi:Pyruvate/2-oxoacid:ferredoxin oxidoreductase delta subunit